MRKSSLKYHFFCCCLLILFLPKAKSQDASQDSSIHKILMVPFGRFNFFTDYPLSEIDSVNKISQGEAYNAYKDSLLYFFEATDNTKWKYVSMPQKDVDRLQHFYTYKYRRKPVNHFGIMILQGFDTTKAAILKNNKADAILFFTDYKIKKASVLYSPKNGSSNLKPYATHITQVVLITQTGKYYANGYIKIKDAPQTPENIAKKNLSIESLKNSYQSLAKELPKILRSKKKKKR